MAGILDVKRRVLDALITVDGRRQMANSTIDISFATFSDEGIFYDSEDGISARDISNLPVFEVTSLPRDVIIPEVDNNGDFSLSLSDGEKIVNGRRVITGSYDVVTNKNGVRTVVASNSVLTGALNVYSGSSNIMTTAMNHFRQLNILRTDDGILDSDFSISKNKFKMTTEEIPVPLSTIKPLVFSDEINYTIQAQYLPPSNRGSIVPLGDYPKLTTAPYENFESFNEMVLLPSISKDQVNINSYANSNNIIGQVFEVNSDGVNKLTVVDYGEFALGGNRRARVFYLGKPIRDADGTPKFCRLFTMVFEK